MKKWFWMAGVCWASFSGCGRADPPADIQIGEGAARLNGVPTLYRVINGQGVVEAEHLSDVERDSAAPIHAWDALTSPTSGAFSGAAGGQYLKVGPDIGTGHQAESSPAVRYQFEIPADAGGSYVVYVRGTGPNTASDSVWATVTTLDGTPVSSATMLSFTVNGVWGWRNTPSVTLSPGRYAVRVAMREDGVAIDKVVLQTSNLAAPVGQGPAETPPAVTSQPFTAWSTAANFVKPKIVLHTATGIDWNEAKGEDLDSATIGAAVRDAAYYLQEGIRKMSGQPEGWEIEGAADVTSASGVLLMTLAGAPQSIREDPRIVATLSSTGGTTFGVETREAYYIRTEANRILVVANRPEGLVVAVPELLESVGYEVIGMGPNWIYTPDRTSGLSFDLEKGGRPGFFTRNLRANAQGISGQGTLSFTHVNPPINMPVPAAPGEFAQTSYNRWRVGRRMRTAAATSNDTGAQPISYQDQVIAYIRANFAPGPNIPGFLAETTLGPDASRPPAGPENYRAIWINSDNAKSFFSRVVNGVPSWLELEGSVPQTNLDISQTFVRKILLEAMISNAETKCFALRPDDLCAVLVEPEDGVGYRYIDLAAERDQDGHSGPHSGPDWYAQYRNADMIPFGTGTYRLNGFKGLAHPDESWDPQSPSDFVYGLDNWLLREYDKRVGDQRTSTGKLKRELIRVTHYSYNFWDVPPNFNVDDRVRVAIAGYSKNRRKGQWRVLHSYQDVFNAFQQLLPNSFQSYRWTYSLDTTASRTMSGIVGASALAQAKALRDYAATGGCRALFFGEGDINFGKNGLLYYLLSRVMLTPQMSDSDLLAAIDHWHQKAYGAGATKMKEYHDVVLNGVPVMARGPQLWAEAMKVIDEAYGTSGLDVASRQRIDDLKTHWYYYHFIEKGQANAGTAAFRELVWKGQMAYQAYLRWAAFQINSSDPTILKGHLTVPYLAANLGEPDYGSGPARYTWDEINHPATGWWHTLKATWPYADVIRFKDPEVDLNDLVQVAEFGTAPAERSFHFNGTNAKNAGPFVKAATAGEEIGFHVVWDHVDGSATRGPWEVFWGLRRFDPARATWEDIVDVELNSTFSERVPVDNSAASFRNVVEIKHVADDPGVYQFDLGATGDAAHIVDLNWNVAANPFESGHGAYRGPLAFSEVVPTLESGVFWFYAPKGTTTLDFQYPVGAGTRKLTIYKRSGSGFAQSRAPISFTDGGVKRVPLTPDETAVGCLLVFDKRPAPLFFSIPILWAKAQSQLMVPRVIAQRDGLTIVP